MKVKKFIPKKVLQIDDNMNDYIIQEFESIKQCSKIMQIPLMGISKVCRGLQYSTKGFKFRFK